MIRQLNIFWLRNRFQFLLLSLFMLMVITPILVDLDAVSIFLELFMTLVMLLSLGASQENKPIVTTGIILAIPAVVVSWLARFIDWPTLQIINYCLAIVFLAYIFTNLMRIILTSKRVTIHVIYGAICAYLILGLVFANIYLLLIRINPESFMITINDGGFVTIQSLRNVIDVFYYSNVTLTTLGYGDIVPVTAVARMLSSVEALIGQLFLALVIARLVALHVSHIKQKLIDK